MGGVVLFYVLFYITLNYMSSTEMIKLNINLLFFSYYINSAGLKILFG